MYARNAIADPDYLIEIINGQLEGSKAKEHRDTPLELEQEKLYAFKLLLNSLHTYIICSATSVPLDVDYLSCYGREVEEFKIPGHVLEP